MQFSKAVLASIFLASTVFATALPQQDETSLALPDLPDLPDLDDAANAADNSTVVEDGAEEFDPLELTTDESTVHVEEKRHHIDGEPHIEARNAASNKILACARSYKGTNYLFGGCKSKAPFGPVKGGMDCSCLSRTCVKKGTGTTIREYFLSLITSFTLTLSSTHDQNPVPLQSR